LELTVSLTDVDEIGPKSDIKATHKRKIEGSKTKFCRIRSAK